MKCSEQLGELAKAMVLVQAQIKPAIKDSANPFFKSKYADLESVWDACRDALCKNGLAVIQTMDDDKLVTTLVHSSGQWISGALKLMPVKSDPQSMGSAITYARRYALAAIVGVVQSDDDGEASMGRQTQPKPIVNEIKASQHDQHMSESERLEMEVAQVFGSADSGKCSLCGEMLKRTKKNDAFYCPNYKDKSGGQHDYIKDLN